MNAEEKAINRRFKQLMDRDVRHVRIGQRHQDGTDITLVGNVWEMHGPDGCCTCCHGRTPRERL